MEQIEYTRDKHKKKSNKITILFVVNNEEEIIEETINGFFHEVSNQLSPNIIVAEDGSTDNTKDILRNLSKKLNMSIVTDITKKGYMVTK